MKEFVYAAVCGPYVKIGFTGNPYWRLAYMTRGKATKLRMPDAVRNQAWTAIKVVRGTDAEETLLLHSLDDFRLVGEW